jgi:hypothetical protein
MADFWAFFLSQTFFFFLASWWFNSLPFLFGWLTTLESIMSLSEIAVFLSGLSGSARARKPLYHVGFGARSPMGS